MPHRTIWHAIPILPYASTRLSKAFYERIGFVIMHRDPNYVMLRQDDGELHLARAGHFWTGTPGSCYFRCPDVDHYFARLQLRSEEIVSAPEDRSWRMREFHLRDPFGNVLRFGQPNTE